MFTADGLAKSLIIYFYFYFQTNLVDADGHARNGCMCYTLQVPIRAYVYLNFAATLSGEEHMERF